MEIKITKRKLIDEAHNSTVGDQWTYLINGRIINDEHTMYRPFKFVLWFNGDDMYEGGYFDDDDRITKQKLSKYIDELICAYTDLIVSYDNCKWFYEECNRSIEAYNERIRSYNRHLDWYAGIGA